MVTMVPAAPDAGVKDLNTGDVLPEDGVSSFLQAAKDAIKSTDNKVNF